MAVREQGAKAILRVLHFGEELFATVGATKHSYDALNMCNIFRKIARKEGDVAEEGQWRRVVEPRLQFIVALNLITGTQYLFGISSLLAEERSCFLQVAGQYIDGVFPLRGRRRRKVLCSMLWLPVAARVKLFKDGHSVQA